ncbi:MAG: UvrD-helicase domain-containing protein [Cruoricaptor ignavus]|nr:UvrD-helicase domain-containing protein [Cruoricaptor ignavus]
MKEQNTPYIAINASAGSGKTYTLVQRILIICLQYENNHDAIKNILALTFTNKAANEMKERIIEWLKDFTKNNYEQNQDLINIQNVLKQQGKNVTLQDLHRRSQKVLDYILHHYSTLNIGTIDKFNARLVRSFAYELGLPQQFRLEIQSEPFLIEAVDKMLDDIGEDETISSAFMDYINYNLDNEERINLSNTLYKTAKHFVNDIHHEELNQNKNFDWQAYEKAKNNLRESITNHKSEIKKLATEAQNLIKSKNLEPTDFATASGGSIGKWFASVLQYLQNKNAKFPLPENEETAVEKISKGAAAKAKNRQADILEILDFLMKNRAIIISEYVEMEKKNKILSEILPLKINKEIQEQLQGIEQENDLVLLSKFNVMINENLKNEPSNFIYEKIGTRYNHFFFDEFQDTSKMQWENILPLKEHTVTSDHSSFTIVGDPKQSIYRFRGGDSELMLNILNKNEESPVKVFVENLGNNWRSAKHIVDFNNELYSYISQDLKPEHHSLFGEQARQIPQKKFLGRVKVNLTEYSRKSDDFYEPVAEQMHRNIQECIHNGYDFSDITILCRTGKEIQKYAQLLGKLTVNYHENESYIKTISEKGLTLDSSLTLRAVIDFLNWESQPKNKQFLVKMLYNLNELGRIKMQDFSEELLAILQIDQHSELVENIEKRFGLKLNRKHLPQLNLYNYIEFFVREFSLPNKETDFLLNFLEMLYNFTQNAGMTVKDFVKYWEEEAHNISIQASENIDAINLMTIHSAKGLEFPVVFLPMKNSHKDNDFDEWYAVTDATQELKSVNIKGFKKEIANYNNDMADFNDQNIYKNKIDRFCIQYVATTRPVEQLFLYLQKPSKSNNYLEIYDFIESKNTHQEDEFDLYPEEEESYKKQKIKETAERKTLEVKSLSETKENTNNIRIATPSKNYQQTKEAVRIGIFVHEILEKIISEKDVSRVLQQYLLEGIITNNEKSAIEERLFKIIKNEKYSMFFNKNHKAFNEKEIMISEDGKTEIYRPDRMVETENGIFVIDFKTGAENEKYEKQVETYREILEKTGRKVAGTEVVYV